MGMWLSVMIFRVLNCTYINNLKIVEVLPQVVFGEIMDWPIWSTFVGIFLSLFTLSEARLFVRKNSEKGEPSLFQSANTFFQKQLPFILTEKMQDIKAIDGIILAGIE